MRFTIAVVVMIDKPVALAAKGKSALEVAFKAYFAFAGVDQAGNGSRRVKCADKLATNNSREGFD